MQDSVDCDYFRTLVKFQGSDIYIFVGAIGDFATRFNDGARSPSVFRLLLGDDTLSIV